MTRVATLCFLCLALATPAAAEEKTSTPEATVRAYFKALKASDFTKMAAVLHPGELKAFKAGFLSLRRAKPKDTRLDRIWKVFFPKYTDLATFEKAGPQAIVKEFLAKSYTADKTAWTAIQRAKNTVLGSVRDGEDIAYALYRMEGSGLEAIDGYVQAMVLKRTKTGWAMLMGSKGRTAQHLLTRLAMSLELTLKWTGPSVERPLKPLPKVTAKPGTPEDCYLAECRAVFTKRRDPKALAGVAHPEALAQFHRRVWKLIDQRKGRKGFEKALVKAFPALKSLEAAKKLSHAAFYGAIITPFLSEVTTDPAKLRLRLIGKLVLSPDHVLLVSRDELEGERSLSITPMKRHQGKWKSLFDSEMEQAFAALNMQFMFMGENGDDD